MKKKGFEFSFAWLFAILVGAVIIFLAIYAATRIAGNKETEIGTYTAAQLSIIFEPLETGLASGKSNIAGLREETRIFNSCFEEGNFGKQEFSVSSKMFGNKWSKESVAIPITNKYVFSNKTEQGKKVYFFSKPFKMPWKVSEIIFLTTKEYCFVNAPEEIQDEIIGLQLQNIRLDNCTNKADEVKVCFGQGNCEIKIEGTCLDNCENEYDSGFVSKNQEKIYYVGFNDEEVDRSLLYAAIFSSKEVYECNIRRLMKRLLQQAIIFEEEANFLTSCGSITSLSQLKSAIILGKSTNLNLLIRAANEANQQNEAAECKLW